MTKKLDGWDTRVKESEAKREPIEIPMPTGAPIVVKVPSGSQAKALAKAQATQDSDGAVMALFGATNGKRLLKLNEDAPFDVLSGLIRDVLAEFGAADSDDASAAGN